MKKYRSWVYKIMFWVFGTLAANIGLIFSGDLFRLKDVEFNVEVKEEEE